MDQPLGLETKKMESFMSWVLKTELHYAYCLRRFTYSTHGAFGAIVLDWYSEVEMVLSTHVYATKTQKDAHVVIFN
jgi:hypothetical protein